MPTHNLQSVSRISYSTNRKIRNPLIIGDYVLDKLESNLFKSMCLVRITKNVAAFAFVRAMAAASSGAPTGANAVMSFRTTGSLLRRDRIGHFASPLRRRRQRVLIIRHGVTIGEALGNKAL